MQKHITSQQGMSLIEVVASIMLLSIILLTFFSFFTQAALFASKTDDAFDAGQYSQELLDIAKTGDYTSDLTAKDLNDIYGTNQPENEPYEIRLNNQVYYPDVTIRPDTNTHQLLITVIITTEQNGEKKELFRTYGYKK